MKNQTLNVCILRSLSGRKIGMSEDVLEAETSIRYKDPTLTTERFKDALRYLSDKAFVETFPDLDDNPLWAITDLGLAYLRENGL